MAKKFLIGSLYGQFIDAMEKLSRHIFPIAFNNQFQDPGTASSNLFDAIEERDASTAHNIADANDESTHILRPSDFRLKSMVCRAPTIKSADQQNDAPNESTAKTKSICTLYGKLLAEFIGTIEWYPFVDFCFIVSAWTNPF